MTHPGRRSTRRSRPLPEPRVAFVEGRRTAGPPRLRAARVRPALPHRCGQDRRRLEGVPLPRSRPAARRRGVAVGPVHRHGDRRLPDGRLPVPGRAVLLGHRARARHRAVGRAAHLARHADPRGRARAPATCSARSGCAVPASRSAWSRTRSRRTRSSSRRTQSVLLPPWAGMPWMIAFAVLALRRRRLAVPGAARDHRAAHRRGEREHAWRSRCWRRRCGSRSRSSSSREVDWRRAFGAIWRSTLLIVLTSLWWAEALVDRVRRTDANVLRFTEQSSTTTATLNPARGAARARLLDLLLPRGERAGRRRGGDVHAQPDGAAS